MLVGFDVDGISGATKSAEMFVSGIYKIKLDMERGFEMKGKPYFWRFSLISFLVSSGFFLWDLQSSLHIPTF